MSVDLVRLITTLNTSGFQKKEPATYQTIIGLINYLQSAQKDINSVTDIVKTLTDAGFLTYDNETNKFKLSKQLIAGTNVSIDNTTKGKSIISATGSGSSGGASPVFINDGDIGNDFGFPIPGLKGDTGNTGPSGPSGSGGNAPLAFDDYSGDDFVQIPNLPIRFAAIQATINGGGAIPSTGVFADVYVPYACTIIANTVLADQSGSAVIDVWVTNIFSSVPTVTNTITASALPTLSSQNQSQDTTLTGWTKSISAGSRIRFNLNSVTTCIRIQLTLTVILA